MIRQISKRRTRDRGLNESPSEKEGKCYRHGRLPLGGSGLNESPSEKEGKSDDRLISERLPSPQ